MAEKKVLNDHDELLALIESYRIHFQFPKSLEKAVNAFNLAAENLTMDDMEYFRRIFDCISNLFDETKDKDAVITDLLQYVDELSKSKNPDITNKEKRNEIKSIFESLKEICPNPERDFRPPRIRVP